MKKILLGVSFLLWIVMLYAQEATPKIFSRYNYYLPGQQPEVLCIVHKG